MKHAYLILFLAALWLGACQSEPDTEDPIHYASLVGTWKPGSDSAMLILSRACCGEKPQVKGMFRFGNRSIALEPRSGLIHYALQKPDSGARTMNAFALHLELKKEGSEELCAVDGLVEDPSGNPEWPDALLSGPFALELAGTQEDSACPISQEQRKWIKEP